MSVKWRRGGEKMGEIDLRKLDRDQVVIHFGGSLTSVDAYTFGNSLISFADTIRAVNEIVNPGQNIEVRLEAVGPGSFKAVVKRVKKGLGGFLSRAPENIFWTVLAVAVIEPYFDNDKRIIEVLEDRVVIRDGGDAIIMSKEAYDQYQNVKDSPKVQRNIRRTFETIEKDEAIENFGLTPSLSDENPLVQIPRDDFARLSRFPEVVTEGSKRRKQQEKSKVIVLKPWVDASKHKWSFEWNGVPITAYLEDQEFLTRVRNHDIKFGNGDALDVLIEFYQDFDENLDVWINDNSSFVVVEVLGYIPKGGERLGL